MYAFEKEIANREMLYPVCSYPYKVIPLTEQAKAAFAAFNKKNSPGSAPIEKSLMEFIKKYFKPDKDFFTGKATFYFDEADEQKRINETKSIAVWYMTESGVPGIFHPKSGKKSYYVTLKEDKDFRVEVGEKITHDQPKTPTFEDIKAL
ncbi:hypothetical protein EVU96_25055 [Bacillus infantis]|uniref:hypothetical protein n=1 Tax=Bacillus infantis TaxID=324767 RepID=UPI00101D2EE4|nr:hypothetical protein [Bacillus infantis]RYI25085.1 hypothetical protein EVU96_25055 [Bacillus infantis]